MNNNNYNNKQMLNDNNELKSKNINAVKSKSQNIIKYDNKFKEKLITLSGVGYGLAEDIIRHGAEKMSDLKRPKYFNMLPAEAQIEITYNINKNIPHNIIKKILKYFPQNLIPVGSYSRNTYFSKDIDLLTTEDLVFQMHIFDSISSINNMFEVVNVYRSGDNRVSFLIKLSKKIDKDESYIKVDIFKTTDDELIFAKFHYTGNKNFNIRTRAQAKRLGYKLNQYGLFKDDIKIDVSDEEHLFNLIDVTPVPPELRND